MSPQLLRLGFAVLVVVLAVLGARGASWAFWRLSWREASIIREAGRHVASALVWVIAASTVLSLIGVPTIAALGVAALGAAVAVSVQGVGVNAASGLWLANQRDWDIDDTIEITGVVAGRVIHARLLSHLVADAQTGRVGVVPNALLLTSVVWVTRASKKP